MIKFGPKAQLTGDTDYWGGYYTKRAQDVLDGKWKSEDTWGGLDSGMVVMAPYTNMPDDVKKMAMDTEAAIRSGKLHPFKCPIVDQDGKTVECKGGDHLDRRPDPEHELVRQRHRRQDSGEVILCRLSSENAMAGSGLSRPAMIVSAYRRQPFSAPRRRRARPGSGLWLGRGSQVLSNALRVSCTSSFGPRSASS